VAGKREFTTEKGLGDKVVTTVSLRKNYQQDKTESQKRILRKQTGKSGVPWTKNKTT